MRKVYTSAGLIQVEEDCWSEFSAAYQFIEAAGGLIENELTGELLFIFRNKRWDLPKGKQDPGEDLQTTAVREVVEECGIPTPQLKNLLCETFHTYQMGQTPILKRTSWFHMSLNQSSLEGLIFEPQLEEGIEKVSWIPKAQAQTLAQESYGTIAEVLNAFFDKNA